MYLGRSLELPDGEVPMCGVLPFSAGMPAPLAIGYVEVTTTGGLLGAGHRARGHVFHHSAISGDHEAARSYELQTPHGERSREGYGVGNVLASYVHLHFASDPTLASSLVDRCRAHGRARAARRGAAVGSG
jgi:cobyrinic acid a,c-diamide synthase